MTQQSGYRFILQETAAGGELITALSLIQLCSQPAIGKHRKQTWTARLQRDMTPSPRCGRLWALLLCWQGLTVITCTPGDVSDSSITWDSLRVYSREQPVLRRESPEIWLAEGFVDSASGSVLTVFLRVFTADNRGSGCVCVQQSAGASARLKSTSKPLMQHRSRAPSIKQSITLRFHKYLDFFSFLLCFVTKQRLFLLWQPITLIY